MNSVVIRQRVKRLLADMKEVTVIGESGKAQEATDAIFKQKPDVVLLDIHLLDGSGIDVLQKLEKNQARAGSDYSDELSLSAVPPKMP